jgi:Zn-dependent M28 family amino/carboxypeptidase
MMLFFVCCILLPQHITHVTAANAQDTVRNPVVAGEIRPIIGQIQKDNLKNIIEHLETYGERSSWKKQSQVVTWAKNRFKIFGLESWTETYENKGQQWTNAFARIKGKSQDSVLFIAHIDSKSYNSKQNAPGADDNGSGVAVLMEIARILKDTRPEKSILFCIFSNEERGQLGSKAFAQKARREKQNIQAVINLDILGYNSSKFPIQWRFLTDKSSFKLKVKIMLKIIKNFFYGIINGGNVLTVGGTPRDGNLVRTVTGCMRSIGGINVKTKIESHCF